MKLFDTLAKKTTAGYLLVTLIFSAGMITSLHDQTDSANLFSKVVNQNVPLFKATTDLTIGINQAALALRAWVLLADEKFKDERMHHWGEQINPALTTLNEIAATKYSPELSESIQLLNEHVRKIQRYQQEIEDIAHQDNNHPALKNYTSITAPLYSRLEFRLLTFADLKDKQALFLDYNGSTQANASRLKSLELFLDRMNKLSNKVNNYLLQPDAGSLKKINADMDAIKSIIIDENLDNELTATAAQTVRDIVTLRDQIIPPVLDVLAARSSSDWDLAVSWIGAKLTPVSAELTASLNNLAQSNFASMQTSFSGVAELSAASKFQLVGIVIFGVLLSVVIGLYIARVITVPMQKALSAVNGIASGNLAVDTTLKGSQEMVVLGNALSRMTSSLVGTTHAAQAVARGNLDVHVEVKDKTDALGNAVASMLEALRHSKQESDSRFAALADSEARSAGIISNMEDGLVNITSEGIITMFNPAAERIFQYRENEVLGRNIKLLVPASHADHHDNYLAAYMRTGDRRFIGAPREVRAQRKDGAEFPASIVVSEIIVGGQRNFIGTVRDITKQKNIELKELEMRVALETEKEKLLEQDWLKTNYALIISRIQSAKTIETMSTLLLSELTPIIEAQVSVFYVRQGVESEPDKGEMDDTVVSLLSSYAYTHRNTIQTRYRAGEGLVGQAALERKPITLTDVPKDYLPIDTGLGEYQSGTVHVLPILFEKDLLGILEICAIKRTSDLQQALLDQIVANLGVFMSTIVGRSRAEYLLERSMQQAQELKDREHQLQLANEAMIRKTEAAEAANKSKSEFLANMSHELRTPLNSLLILAESLASNKDGNLTHRQKQSAEIIKQSGTDLLGLINDILDLAKVEAGKVIVNAAEFPLSDIVSELHAKFDHVAESKNLAFSVNIAPDTPACITSDITRINQMLRNFLSNAFKFTHQGRIDVTIQTPASNTVFTSAHLRLDNTIAMAVTDTGIGIPQNKLESIFDAFEQVDGSTSREYGGTGLGLAIVKEMAKLLGGEITVTSQLGLGSTFTLILPLDYYAYSGENPHAIQSETAPIQHILPVESMITADFQRPPNKPRNTTRQVKDDRSRLKVNDAVILIIEDDPAFIDILIRSVHDKGFMCVVSETGLEGITMAKQYKPDAIVMDIGLPDISGLEVFNLLLKDPLTSHIPIYFISVYDNSHEALQKGAIGYLTKPITQEQLYNALEHIREVALSPINSVLIVEDDLTTQQYLEVLLQTFNLDVAAVDSAEKGLELLKHRSFGLMMLDLMLPGMSGQEMLSAIEHDAKISQPHVIIYSAQELSDQEKLALNKYAVSFIAKNGGSAEKVLSDLLGQMAQPKLVNIDSQIALPKPQQTQPAVTACDVDQAIFPGKKVLLVDDDPRNIFAISLLLKEVGMDVHMANNGQKAVEFVSSHDDIDIVLMDIMMPVMNGFDAIGKIRKELKKTELPIVAVTAKAMQEDKDECLAAGANDYLAKPVEANRLFAKMGALLANKKQTAAKASHREHELA